jgi:arginine utilization protein RocB
VLFSILQRKCLDINYCQQEIENALMRIKKLRNEENFIVFYQKAQSKLSSVIEQNPPKRMKVSNNNMDQTTVCKALYFEILDNIIVQIEVRFKDLADLKYFALADSSKFQSFANNFPHHLINILFTQYVLLYI